MFTQAAIEKDKSTLSGTTTIMQYLTSKTSLLTFVVILAISLVLLWIKYSSAPSNMWQSNYARPLNDFEYYSRTTTVRTSNLDMNEAMKKKMLPQPINWAEIQPMDSPKKDQMHDKWIVLTTISAPTEDVIKLSKVDGWKVIVVADKKTPEPWQAENIVFLSLQKQKELGYRLVDLMPYNNYARKSIGHLYAIQHGAKYIYETDDDNHPSDGKFHFNLTYENTYRVYDTKRSAVNAYEFLGQSTIWPRGYPLDLVADPPEYHVMKCENARPLVQQGVVDGDPDIDAIYRLTRKDKGVRLDVQFDRKQEIVLLPKGAMCPYNAQNTLYVYDAFWTLLLPGTVNMRITDIWRSYFMQRLLWEIGGHLSFFPPSAYQYRSAHNYLKDFIDEKMLYHDSGKMVDFLLAWKPTHDNLFDNIMDLTIKFVHMGFLRPADIHLTEAWLQDLVRIGYKIPALKPLTGACEKPVAGSKSQKRPKEQPSSYLRARKLIDVTSFR